MKVLIVSGGTPPDYEMFKEEFINSDITLGADSGCEVYFRYNARLDYGLGDFDSINGNFKDRLKSIKTIKYNSEKDNTDSEIAVLKAIELGATEIALLGFTGTRLDHTISNLGLLNICLEKGIKAYIRDKNNIIYLTDKNKSIKRKKGYNISFQGFRSEVQDFSIKNAKYELNNYKLSIGDGRCVSNEFLGSDIDISFTSGKVLVIYCKD